MICWPFFADQQINSRFVEKVWKLGLDIKDTCDRNIIEKAIREVMEIKKDEFQERASKMANLARDCVGEGGSSCQNLKRLVQDIRSKAMSLK
ncbi:hypothetical protein LIER_42343 [Lithospermum erythrorhizon]|uniref:Uncharacterized protein n=1 Tax=Lithospermum erythrorhizon TaxID=34254 RepID=A0AAV3RR99_LITER